MAVYGIQTNEVKEVVYVDGVLELRLLSEVLASPVGAHVAFDL